MEIYQVKQTVKDRTLTVELPEEFEGLEVERKVIISNSNGKLPTKVTKEKRG